MYRRFESALPTTERRADSAARAWLETEAKALLREYEIPFPEERFACNAAEAGALAREIVARHPELPEVDGDYDEDQMRIEPPVDPLFRAGELGLAYDESQDRMALAVNEILLSGMEEEDGRDRRERGARSSRQGVDEG